jgi:hypothetical protein
VAAARTAATAPVKDTNVQAASYTTAGDLLLNMLYTNMENADFRCGLMRHTFLTSSNITN